MKRYCLLLALFMSAFFGGMAYSLCVAQAAEATVSLPQPEKSGGMPLMEALAARQSHRSFSDKPLSDQELSNLLWATWGVNREDGKRTAPTAMNKMDVEVYVALAQGVYRYDAPSHSLELVLEGNTLDRFGGAPVTLLFATSPDTPWGGMHLGSLYQNAGLYCASIGLGNVVKGTGRDKLDGELSLPDGYKVLIIQSIGWPQ